MARIVATLPVGPLGCNCVILADHESRAALVVDPGGDPDRILAALAASGLRCVLVVNTHAHIDHVAANYDIVRATGAPLRQHAADRPLYEALPAQTAWLLGAMGTPQAAAIDGDLADGERLAIGAQTGTVLHTPGHSPGSICLLFASGEEPPLLIAGDTLFAGGIGRSDLPGGNEQQLLSSLRTRILPLDDATRVIPGHGPETTIGEERRHNPYLASS